MRCCHSERPSTFVFTTLLFILSLTATLVESASVHGFRARHAWRKRASSDVIPTGQVVTPTPQTLLSPTVLPTATGFSPTPTSLPAVAVPSLLPTPSLTPPSPPSPQTSNPASASISFDLSTPSLISTASTTTSQIQVQATSQGTPLSSSSSSQHSSSSSVASSTSGAATVRASTSITQNSITVAYTGLASTTGYPTGTTISATPSSESSSNSGFFSNTGAVAGTFTVAGLFGIAGIIGIGMLIARRRISRPYEDDMEYLEKKPEPAVELSQSQNFVVGDLEESSDLSHASNAMEVTVPPAAHLYPQHDVYFAREPISNGSDVYETQEYYPQGAYPPQVYGIAYPSRESYAAADAYGGMEESLSMPNPFDNVAPEQPAAQHSNQQLRPASPPLTAYLHRSIDSFYGSSASVSHGHAI